MPSCGRDIAVRCRFPTSLRAPARDNAEGSGPHPPAWAAPLRALQHGEAQGCVRSGLCRPLSVKNCLDFSRRCSCLREHRRVVMDGRWR